MLLRLRKKLGTWFVDAFVPAVFPRANPVARWILKSPLHGLISWYVVLLLFKGRWTGRRYEVPLAYHRAADGVVEAVTSSKGTWWRNLGSEQQISVVFRGTKRPATIEVVRNDEQVVGRALRSRDLLRRFLVPAAIEQTVLLRIHLAG